MKPKNSTYAGAYSLIDKDFINDFNMLKKFSTPIKGSIVAVGAGTGRLINAKLKNDLLFVENDKEMLKILKDRVCRYKSAYKNKIIFADAFNMPFKENSVEGVLLDNSVIAEMILFEFAIAESFRILNSGGKILISTMNPITWPKLRYNELKKAKDNGVNYSYYIKSYPTPHVGKYFFETRLETYCQEMQRTYIIPQILMPIEKLITFVKRIGFQIDHIYGDFDLKDFDKSSSLMGTIIATKPKRSPVKVTFPELQSKYDEYADQYNSIAKKGKYTVPNWVAKQTTELKGKYLTVLDLACANGLISQTVHNAGIDGQFYGIDFSSQMLNEARKKKLFRGLLQADLSKGLPLLAEQQFDLILACGFLEFIPNPAKLLKQVSKSLKPYGTVILTFEKLTSESLDVGKLDPSSNMTKYPLSKNNLLDLLKSSGLEIIKLVERVGYTSPTLKKKIPYFMIKAGVANENK